MAATSIYFNGRMTRIPGSYSQVDASALESIGLSASGYIACVGTALGGKPYSAIDTDDVPGTLQKSTRPGKAKEYFQAGSNLLKAEDLLFAPSNEEDIAGAQRVYWIKVNDATQSAATFNNADGPAMTTTSEDYGYHTTRINVQIGDGTNYGKKVIIVFDDVTETLDDIGGQGMFSVAFAAATPALGFTTITFAISATATIAAFTRTQAGLDTDVAGQVVLGGYSARQIELASDDASDDQTVTVYGVDESGDAIVEEMIVNGVTTVVSVDSFAEFHGARISAAPTGTVTIRNLGGGAVITTLTAAILTRGLGIGSNLVVGGGVLTLVADAACTDAVTVVGRDNSGQVQAETVVLTGTVPLSTTGTWSYIDYIAVGALAAARTLTISGTAATAPYTGGYDTLQKQADYYNSKDGFTFTKLSGESTFQMTNMDIYAATNIKGVTATFGADLYLMIVAINNGSDLVTAERESGATGAPTNTTTAAYLTGGHEGSTTPGAEGTPFTEAADWQSAIDLLKKLYVNTIVVLTADPAVHAMLKSHNAYMCGAGRMERDGVVGMMNTGLTGLASKSECRSQLIALNTRHLRAVAQQCERYDSDGNKEKMDPYFTACLPAGMQAGSAVGTSLVHRYINTLGMYSSSTVDPKDDAEDLIEMGLMFAEQVDGSGHRWVRNITTYLSSSNIAYTDAHMNEEVNYAVYNFRTELEEMIAEKGFAGTVQAADGRARNKLTELMDEKVLNGWRSLSITIVSDVMEVAAEMSPMPSINFVKNYIHLYIAPVSAAA